MDPQSPKKMKFADALPKPRGPASRSLVALEGSWIKARINLEAMMEAGRVPRDAWGKAQLHLVHGTFDIRDPDNGDLLMKVEKGVRSPAPPSSGPRPSIVH